MNKTIEERLEGIREVLACQARASAPMSTASKGREREAFVDAFLRTVFPSHFRFGTGDIADATGMKSGQVDVVVEYPFFPSFPVPGDPQSRLYFAEGVAAAIEVKSDLADQWDDVESTTAKVKALTFERIREQVQGVPLPCQIPVIAVGFRGYKTLPALKNRLMDTPADSRPSMALIVDEGGLFFSPGERGFQEISGQGALAMYWFLIRLTWYLTKLQSGGVAGSRYVQGAGSTSDPFCR